MLQVGAFLTAGNCRPELKVLCTVVQFRGGTVSRLFEAARREKGVTDDLRFTLTPTKPTERKAYG